MESEKGLSEALAALRSVIVFSVSPGLRTHWLASLGKQPIPKLSGLGKDAFTQLYALGWAQLSGSSLGWTPSRI